MRIENHICTNGKTVMQYIPETDEDVEEIYNLINDGVIANEPAQRVPDDRTPEQIENGAFAED